MPGTSGGDWETHREPGVIDQVCNGYHDEDGYVFELAYPHSVQNSNIYYTPVSSSPQPCMGLLPYIKQYFYLGYDSLLSIL